MTLLIVLASIAAMEFVLRREVKTPSDPQQEWARRHLCHVPLPESVPTNTSALLALGEALRQHGRGSTPRAQRRAADKIARP
jgi:hypothetical protein